MFFYKFQLIYQFSMKFELQVPNTNTQFLDLATTIVRGTPLWLRHVMICSSICCFLKFMPIFPEQLKFELQMWDTPVWILATTIIKGTMSWLPYGKTFLALLIYLSFSWVCGNFELPVCDTLVWILFAALSANSNWGQNCRHHHSYKDLGYLICCCSYHMH